MNLEDRARFALLDRMQEERAYLIGAAQQTCDDILGEAAFTIRDVDVPRRCLEFELQGIRFRFTLKTDKDAEIRSLEVQKHHTWFPIKELADLGAAIVENVPQLSDLTDVFYPFDQA